MVLKVPDGSKASFDVKECSDHSKTFLQDLNSTERFLKVLRCFVMFRDVLSLSEALLFVPNGSQMLLKNLRHILMSMGCFEDF